MYESIWTAHKTADWDYGQKTMIAIWIRPLGSIFKIERDTYCKRHKPTPQIRDLLDPNKFTPYYKRMETRLVGDCFDNQLMENIEEFSSCYADETPLNVIDIVHDIVNAPINTKEIVTLLNRIKANKAADADGIAAELFKCSGDIIALPLTALYNRVMLTSLYPSTWCAGLIHPIHKRDSPFLPDN